MSLITTQVFDTTTGHGAKDIPVTLEFHQGHGEWKELGTGNTDSQGLVKSLVDKNFKVMTGKYRITFQTGSYFHGSNIPHFYPYITIVFELGSNTPNCHIPLHLSPFAYSTSKN